jgi:hypothetical protein
VKYLLGRRLVLLENLERVETHEAAVRTNDRLNRHDSLTACCRYGLAMRRCRLKDDVEVAEVAEADVPVGLLAHWTGKRSPSLIEQPPSRALIPSFHAVKVRSSTNSVVCEHLFVTSQGSAHGRFTRAIQQRNL